MSPALSPIEATELLGEAVDLCKTQAQLARLAGVSQPGLSIALSKKRVTAKLAKKVAKAVRRKGKAGDRIAASLLIYADTLAASQAAA